jgi:hypothetical protein
VALLVGADAMHPKSRDDGRAEQPRAQRVHCRACSSKDTFWQVA